MSDVLVPGGRDVRGTVDEPTANGTDGRPADAVDGDPADGVDAPLVVACPPHPQHGGSRSDGRLVAVADALTDRGVGCLRIDYGPWDGGIGERADVRNAIQWALDRADRVGVFGYSFGAAEAILAAERVDADATLEAVSVLAPPERLGPDLDVADAFEQLEADEVPLQVLVGSRDTTVNWEPVAERAAAYDLGTVVELPADHFFLGTQPEIAAAVADFFEGTFVA